MQKLLYRQQSEKKVSDSRDTEPCGTPNVMFHIVELQFMIEP